MDLLFPRRKQVNTSGYLDRPVRNFIVLHGILGPQEPLYVWHPYRRKKIMRLYRSASASVDTLLTEMGLECLDWFKAEKTRIGKMLGIPVANDQGEAQPPAQKL
jgi:hypothetical protein